jgi:hypothetical protein
MFLDAAITGAAGLQCCDLTAPSHVTGRPTVADPARASAGKPVLTP